MNAEPPAATFTTYEALVETVRARRIALGMSQLAVDQRAGLPDGYTSKVEMSLTNPSAKNARAIGRESLPLLLGAVGLELAAMPATARHRQNASEINTVTSRPSKIATMSERGRKGAQIQRARMTEKQYRAHQRKAARSRWEKHRKEKAATKRSRCAVPALAAQDSK